jgi:hypothetical protein
MPALPASLFMAELPAPLDRITAIQLEGSEQLHLTPSAKVAVQTAFAALLTGPVQLDLADWPDCGPYHLAVQVLDNGGGIKLRVLDLSGAELASHSLPRSWLAAQLPRSADEAAVALLAQLQPEVNMTPEAAIPLAALLQALLSG